MSVYDQLNSMPDVQDYNAFFRSAGPQAARKKKGFLLDNISTAGGILGGVAGSLVTPLAGTAAGAGIGSALGQALENKIAGDKLSNDVLKEGALGAVFGAGPLKLAKAGVGATVGRKIAKDSLKDALATGVEKPLKTSTTGRLNSLGNKALASQYGTISKPVARANDPIKTFGELANYGIEKPKDAERIASSITGSSGILSKTVAKALEGTTPISTHGIKKTLREAIVSNGLVDKDAKAVKQIIESQLKTLKQSGNSPSVTLKVMQNLERRAANLQGKGGNYRMATPERVDQANALLAVRNELQDRIFNMGGGNENVSKVLTPKLREKLISLHPNNKNWQSFVDDQVMKAKDVATLRSHQAPFVRVKNIIDEGDTNALTFGGRASQMPNAGTVSGMVVSAVKDTLKNPAARIVSRPLRNAGQGMSQPIKQSKKGISTRLATVGGINTALADQSMGPNISDINNTTIAPTNSTANIPSINSIVPSTYSENNNLSSENSPFDIANIETNIQKMVQGGATSKQIQEYLSIADAVNSLKSKANKTSTLNATQQQQASNAQSGLDSLMTIAQTLESNPKAAKLSSLPGGSFTQALTGTGNYTAAINNATDVIGRLRSGGAINADEEKRFRSLLPASFDTPETVQYKLNSLSQLFQRFINPQAASPDVSSLQAALGM